MWGGVVFSEHKGSSPRGHYALWGKPLPALSWPLASSLVAGTISTGCAQAGAHRHVPAARGAAHAAGHWAGARHAQVSTHDPAARAADTCEPRRLSQRLGWRRRGGGGGESLLPWPWVRVRAI